MRSIIDTSEARLRRRILGLPDMTTHAVGLLERDRATGVIPQVAVTLTKRGDTLSFDFSGSSPQLPTATNCTESGLLAGVTGALLPTLGFDIAWNAGLFRPVTVTCPDGLICNARRPAAVSDSIAGAAWEVESAALVCVSKLLACSDSYLGEAQAGVRAGGHPRRCCTGPASTASGSSGARSSRSPPAAAPTPPTTACPAFGNHSIERVLISNMETIEQDMPVLVPVARARHRQRRPGHAAAAGSASAARTSRTAARAHSRAIRATPGTCRRAAGLFGGVPGRAELRVHLDRGLRRHGLAAGRRADPGRGSPLAGTRSGRPSDLARSVPARSRARSSCPCRSGPACWATRSTGRCPACSMTWPSARSPGRSPRRYTARSSAPMV